MNPFTQHAVDLTRRQFFGDAGLRLGGIALAALLGDRAAHAGTATALVVRRACPASTRRFPGSRTTGRAGGA